MKAETFEALWNRWSEAWYSTAHCYHIERPNEKIEVKSLCRLKSQYASVIHENYEAAKAATKRLYFREASQTDGVKRISRYKRAAVITYAVIKSEPLLQIDADEVVKITDPYYLKERLAVFVAIGSIIQDFPQERVSALLKDEDAELFSFDDLGKDRTQDDDTFEESLYKDLFLSDIYGNFNVLTMANVYGLLTEKCSLLSQIIPDNASKN